MTDIKKYPLGRKLSPFDSRDYNLRHFIPQEAFEEEPITARKWDFPSESLNQGDFPHCVGFSGASWGINSPINTVFANDDGHKMYYECKVVEGEPNEENGAYVRSIAKVLKSRGRLDVYAFAPDIATIRWWLLNKGPVITGTIWTQSMFTPDENNIITIDANVVGGHAYLLNEWREDGYIGIQNSWGKEWGDNGKAYIHFLDFEKLFKYGGEAMAGVELPTPIPNQETKKHWLLELILDFFKSLFRL